MSTEYRKEVKEVEVPIIRCNGCWAKREALQQGGESDPRRWWARGMVMKPYDAQTVAPNQLIGVDFDLCPSCIPAAVLSFAEQQTAGQISPLPD
jgi:hypothetical protein